MNEEKDDGTSTAMYAIIVMISFIFIIALVEVSFVAIAYFNADEINCNFLWCEFTTIRDRIEKNTSVSIVMTQDCFINGHRVNCSAIGATT